jgi:hypothetical protein
LSKLLVSADWQIKESVFDEGATVTPQNSEVVLDVPACAVDNAEIFMSVSANISQISSKLGLPKNETIISPFAEFWTDESTTMKQKCRITLLQKLPEEYKVEHIHVYCVTSSQEGRLLKTRLKYNDFEENACFTLTSDRRLVVLTNHFSGYVCSACNAQDLFCLTVLVAGVHQKANNGHHWANVSVYIWDSRLRNTDFQQVG